MMDLPSFSLTGFLDWLDEAAGGLIRLAYLAAGVTAVAVYFGAGQLPAGIDGALNVALPWALAFALETHTYLTARRVRAAWQERDRAGLQVNAGVLAILLAFSAWNQLGYLSGVWTPPHSGPLALPTWAAYAVRALIVPAAFMAAAFLAPLAPPITAQIEGEARATLADVFKIARKQRRKMLREAEARGRDMTGALVELVADDETRRIISHAYNAIRATPQTALAGAQVASETQAAIGAPAHFSETGGHSTATPAANLTAQTEGAVSLDTPTKPPTGPGSPTVAAPAVRRPATTQPNVLRLPERPAAPPRKRAAARASTKASAKGVRTPTASVEKQARAAWRPGMSVGELQRAAKISRNAAMGWRRTLNAEGAPAGTYTSADTSSAPSEGGQQYAQ